MSDLVRELMRKADESYQTDDYHSDGYTAKDMRDCRHAAFYEAAELAKKHEEYNGWPNRETWACNLWLTNDEGSYNHCRVLARLAQAHDSIANADYLTPNDVDALWRSYLADALQEFVKELFDPDESLFDAQTRHGMMSDVGSLWRVDWQVIASHFVDELAEETEAMQEQQEGNQ